MTVTMNMGNQEQPAVKIHESKRLMKVVKLVPARNISNWMAREYNEGLPAPLRYVSLAALGISEVTRPSFVRWY